MITGLTKNNFTQKLATGAAALGVLAGVGIVNAPSASAVPCFSGPASGFGSVTCDDKVFTFMQADILRRAGDTIEIDEDLAGNFDFTYDLVPDYEGPNGAFIKYMVEITDPTKEFWAIGLDSTVSNVLPPVEEVTKLVEWTGGSQLLTSTNGAAVSFMLPNGVKKVTITDTLFSGPGVQRGSIASFQNSFVQHTIAVPEPSSVLGLLAVGGLGLGMLRKKQG